MSKFHDNLRISSLYYRSYTDVIQTRHTRKTLTLSLWWLVLFESVFIHQNKIKIKHVLKNTRTPLHIQFCSGMSNFMIFLTTHWSGDTKKMEIQLIKPKNYIYTCSSFPFLLLHLFNKMTKRYKVSLFVPIIG